MTPKFRVLAVVLLAGCAAIVGSMGAAFAQSNCQPWLRAAQQERARGNINRSDEALRIYRECVRQARVDEVYTNDRISDYMLGSDPMYLGPLLYGAANPSGSRVVRIPGYQRPNLAPGRPPGVSGGPRQPQTSSGSSCPGGCSTSGASGGTHGHPIAMSGGAAKSYDRSVSARRYGASRSHQFGHGGLAAKVAYPSRASYGAAQRRPTQMRRLPHQPGGR